MRKKQIPPFGLRMEPELKRKIETSAHLNGRSINAEIIYQLRRIYCPELFKHEENAA